MSSTSHHSSSSSSKSSSTSISISYSSSPSRRFGVGSRAFNPELKHGSAKETIPIRPFYNFGKRGHYGDTRSYAPNVIPWHHIGLNQVYRFKPYSFVWPYQPHMLCNVPPAVLRDPYLFGRRNVPFPTMDYRRSISPTPVITSIGNNRMDPNKLYRRALMKLLSDIPTHPISYRRYLPTTEGFKLKSRKYRLQHPKRSINTIPITQDLFRFAMLLPLVPGFTANHGSGNPVIHPLLHLHQNLLNVPSSV